MPSKVMRLSGPAQEALQRETANLPSGSNTSARVLVLCDRASRVVPALPDGVDAVEVEGVMKALGFGGGQVSKEDLDAALQRLRMQLLADFAEEEA